jgi:predicted O-methyltransferase YrrM
VNPGDRRAIFALAAYLKPRRVLEIGTHIGSSTVMLASALNGTDATITTVDIRDVNDPQARPWEQVGMAHSPAELVTGLATVEFIVTDSVEYLTKNEGPYDLIFLDGDHAAPTVYRELPLALSKLSTTGVVLIHDYFPDARKLWPAGELIVGPALAVRRLQREGLQVRVLPLGELPWPTKLGSNVTSLALALNARGSS